MSQHDTLTQALQEIADWNSHTTEFAVDYGSNGVRDFYRCIARAALSATQPAQAAQGEPWTLDDDGRAMIVNSPHYTPESVKAIVDRLKDFADPEKSTQADWENLDWRSWCNVLWRVVTGLAHDVPLQQPAVAQGAGEVDTGPRVLRGERGVLVRLLVEADKVLSTLEGESTDEQEMLEGLRRQILAATAQHRPQESDLLSVRAGLGA